MKTVSYDARPLRSARADQNLMVAVNAHIYVWLTQGGGNDFVRNTSRLLATKHFVNDNLAQIAVLQQLKTAIVTVETEHANRALADGLPKTAIAEALGLASATYLDHQLPGLQTRPRQC